MRDLLVSLGGPGLTDAIALGALILLRILPMVFLAPFLGGTLAPAPVKIGIALALSVSLYPAIATSLPAPVPDSTLLYLGLMAKELLLGFVVGFLAQLVFRIIEIAGHLTDTLRGANLVTALLPELGERDSVLASFLFQALVVVFLSAGGHLLFLDVFAESFRTLPPTVVPSVGLAGLAELCARAVGEALAAALALAAPALLAILLADIALGLVGRVAPQIHTYFLGLPLKAMAGVAMTLVALAAILEAARGHLGEMIRTVTRALGFFA